MTSERDIERVLDRWFAERPTEVAERVLEQVADQIARQPQKPAWRVSWRDTHVIGYFKPLAAVAAVILVAVVGFALLRPSSDSNVGGPATPSPTPSATSSPTPSPTPRRSGMDIPGESTSWSVMVPPGWTGQNTWTLTKSQGYDAPDGIGVAVTSAVNVPTDPCDGLGKESTATTPADVVAALRARDDLVVSNEVDTTLGGFAGTRVDVEVPADLSAVCGSDNLIIFAEPDGRGIYAQGPAALFRMWILDVEGVPIAFFIDSFAGTPADDMAEAESIIESSIITP